MFTGFDKAWLPFVIAGVGVLVYHGFLTGEQGKVLGESIGPMAIALAQAILVFLFPNKS